MIQLFKVGKTYRTRNNLTAQVCDYHPELDKPYRIVVEGNAHWALRDGQFMRFAGRMDSDIDWMEPGTAIEDMPIPPIGRKPEVSPEVASLQRSVANLFATIAAEQLLRREIESRVDAIDKWRRS